MSKPTLKFKLNTGGKPSISSPSPSTPGGTPKLKINFGSSSKPSTPTEGPPKPAPPAPLPVTKSKAGRARKPSAKIVDANINGKRFKDDSSDDDEADVPLAVERPAKKQKIKLSIQSGGPKTPVILKGKFKGKPPKRPLGEGYDSEASDREIDPVIEEEFVLRMMPGPDCDYLRDAIENRLIGVPRAQGGADVQLKFFHAEGRRAAVTIRRNIYAATLVDLPCVIEGMKSWDKRGWWKSADICQMLYVFAQVPSEAVAQNIELPKTVDPNTFQFPHGLTPPMHYARKRRFRKRISRTAIEAVEAEVERLLEADDKAISTKYEVFDPDAGSRGPSAAYSPAGSSPGGYDMMQNDEYSGDEDAEGEVDDGGYFGYMNGNGGEEMDVDDLEAGLEAELMNAFEADEPAVIDENATPAESTPGIFANGETPVAPEEPEEDSGDDSFESGADDDAAGDDDVDEDERARQAQLADAREDIAEMERQIEVLQNQMAAQGNPILKTRIRGNIDKIKAELVLKKSAIGDTDED